MYGEGPSAPPSNSLSENVALATENDKMNFVMYISIKILTLFNYLFDIIHDIEPNTK